jgi:GDP-D-mannose dehydratase
MIDLTCVLPEVPVISFSGTSVLMSLNSWQGSGINEEGIDVKSGKTLVKVDSQYFRPAEVE